MEGQGSCHQPLTFSETSNHHITGLCPPSNSPTIRMTQILDLLQSPRKALTSTGNKLILTPT